MLVGFFAKPFLKAEGPVRFLWVGKPVSELLSFGGEGGLTSALGMRS